MDPQCDDYWLPMYRIAELYDQCGVDRGRIRRWLNNTYWRGEFEPFARPSSPNYPMTPRREILPVWRDYVHPGIRFTPKEIPIEPRDDGSIVVDLRSSIVLPEETDKWTGHQCEAACKSIAQVDLSNVSLNCSAGLMCQFVGAYELFAICEKCGATPPPFWRRFAPNRNVDIHKLARFVSWFHCKITAHERLTKEQLRAEAIKAFSISSTAFDKVWREFSPEARKSPGRPPGSKNRN
jgi:hypothetical protein